MPKSTSNALPVDQYDQAGKLLRSFPSIYKASQATGLMPDKIRRVLPGTTPNRFTCGGFYWRRKGEPLGQVQQMPKPGRASIRIRLEKEGNEPQEFPSQTAAARHLKVSQSRISTALAQRGRCEGYFITQAA